jgi:hypothetical protein
MTDSHAASRRRVELVRNLGKALIVLALLAAAASVLLLFVEVDLIGATSTGFTTCGGAVDPVTHQPGLASEVCGAQLGAQTIAGIACGALALASGVTGAVVLYRNPARLGF